MNESSLKQQTLAEHLAVLNGENLDKFRKAQALHNEIKNEAKEFINLPPSRWPQLEFNWDLTTSGQLYALDGVEADEFLKHYPDMLCLAWVDFKEFDSKLCHFNRRVNEKDLWNSGDNAKTANMIAYLAKGLPITPPLINVNSLNELCLNGGNHRYAVAKFSGIVKFLPVYFEPSRLKSISDILDLSFTAPECPST